MVLGCGRMARIVGQHQVLLYVLLYIRGAHCHYVTPVGSRKNGSKSNRDHNNLGYCEVKGKHPISVYAFLKRQETCISGIYGEHGHVGRCFSQFASCESITKYVCNTNVSLHTYLISFSIHRSLVSVFGSKSRIITISLLITIGTYQLCPDVKVRICPRYGLTACLS